MSRAGTGAAESLRLLSAEDRVDVAQSLVQILQGKAGPVVTWGTKGGLLCLRPFFGEMLPKAGSPEECSADSLSV